MTDSSHPTLDAAAFEVLRDVASQEDSVLLRVPVGRGRGIDLWLGRDPVSAGAPFLSSAERHLLEVHRDEVASWMRLAAFQRLFEDPQKAGLMARELDAKRLIELPGQAALATQATDLLRAADPRYLPLDAQPILRRASARRNPRPQDPWTLAALSLRMVPHPAPQQWFAVRALERGELAFVRRWINENCVAGSAPPRGPVQRANLELRGALAAAELRWRDAADWYAQVAQSAFATKSSVVCWALNAARAGDSAGLQSAVRYGGEGIAASDEMLAQTLERSWQHERKTRGDAASTGFKGLAANLDGGLGELLRKWAS